MSGIRLRHPSLRNCTYTLIHQGRPLKAPVDCWVCVQTHFHKTYHLGLDGLGEVVVSETVYERLKEAGLDELRAVAKENSPERQVVAPGAPHMPSHVVSRENGSRR